MAATATGFNDRPSVHDYLEHLRQQVQAFIKRVADDEPHFITVEIKPEDLERMHAGENFRLGIPVRKNAPNFMQLGLAFLIGAIIS